MVLRSFNSIRAYRKHRRITNGASCSFCNLAVEQILYRNDAVAVIANKFPYVVWDFCRVRNHLLVVPLDHRESVAELSAEAKRAYMDAITRFESQGYNFYGRGPGTASKSIAHQHTHLIAVEPRFLNPVGIIWAFVADDARHIAKAPRRLGAHIVQRIRLV